MSYARLHAGGGYGSELDDAASSALHRPPDAIQAHRPPAAVPAALPSRDARLEIADKARRVEYGIGVARGLTAYQRHQRYINDYVRHYAGPAAGVSQPSAPPKTDHDVLREHYRFIREEADDDVSADGGKSSWEKQLARRYYDKLFREYCLADMSYYQHGKIGLRWRTQAEVFSGKGQFVCGNKACAERALLNSYEVNFAYSEDGQKKNALVKLRCCPGCADKLHFKQRQRRDEQQQQRRKKKQQARKKDRAQGLKDKKAAKRRRRSSDDSSSSGSGSSSDDDDDGHEGTHQQPAAAAAAAAQTDQQADTARAAASEIWSKRPELERTKEDEYEEFFEGLFM
eukprot:TRINITY_DN5730_c0_g1_i2.p1 TRINITY_DN5730_c0_g1~~TRINITY_DN5730_c0_g1_i2.p1  ORF type:complete len:342 (-),score=158.29 TRINITY_DN5730_c0_g1_i2:74-1099(-)